MGLLLIYTGSREAAGGSRAERQPHRPQAQLPPMPSAAAGDDPGGQAAQAAEPQLDEDDGVVPTDALRNESSSDDLSDEEFEYPVLKAVDETVILLTSPLHP